MGSPIIYGVSHTYDRGSVIAEYGKDEDRKARYIRGHALISSENKEGSKSYYLHNAHGDVTKVVDATGNVQNSYSYDAFGNTTSYTGKVENRFRYSGEQYDTITGQYYIRARYYDPSQGRFTQEDTFRGVLEDPQTLNLYVYCRNNPVIFVDPEGNFFNLVAGLVAGAVKATINVASRAVGDIITGKSSTWEDYAAEATGGFVGGFVAGSTGNIMLGNIAENVTTVGVKRGLSYIQKKDTLSADDLVEDTFAVIGNTALDVAGGWIGDKIISKVKLPKIKLPEIEIPKKAAIKQVLRSQGQKVDFGPSIRVYQQAIKVFNSDVQKAAPGLWDFVWGTSKNITGGAVNNTSKNITSNKSSNETSKK